MSESMAGYSLASNASSIHCRSKIFLLRWRVNDGDKFPQSMDERTKLWKETDTPTPEIEMRWDICD